MLIKIYLVFCFSANDDGIINVSVQDEYEICGRKN